MPIETMILIPNFNGQIHLAECLSAVFLSSYLNFKIILIDDGSTDDSIYFVKNNFPQTEILALTKNYGFATVINKGIKHSLEKYNPKYIAVLNNDTRVDKNWLKYLIEAAQVDENIVAVASNMLFYDDPTIINSQGGTETFGGHGQDINYLKKITDVKSWPKNVLSACFGAALLKTKYLSKIGLLDERYYSYIEDLDWGWRANLLGYRIVFEPQALVYHKGSASWQNQFFKKQYLCIRNNFCTIVKNYQLTNLLKFLLFIPFYYFLLSFAYIFNCKLAGNKLVKIYSKKISWPQKIMVFFIPLRVLIWNIKNIKKTLALRKEIQARRKISDEDIFKFFI